VTLRIRQIVVAAADLEQTVDQLSRVLGVQVAYRDPELVGFGLVNAVMVVGDQFLEVVSPNQPQTAAGRHIERHGDSAYMLILQTDDLARDRARIEARGVRIVWEANRPDISAIHLHPKDIGGAIVSVDQPDPPAEWPWAGERWREAVNPDGARRVVSATVGARDPEAMARRWAEVLGTEPPADQGAGYRIGLDGGELLFEPAEADVITEYGIAMPEPQTALENARTLGLRVNGDSVVICGTRFRLG